MGIFPSKVAHINSISEWIVALQKSQREPRNSLAANDCDEGDGDAKQNRYDLEPKCKEFLATKLDKVLEKGYKFRKKKMYVSILFDNRCGCSCWNYFGESDTITIARFPLINFKPNVLIESGLFFISEVVRWKLWKIFSDIFNMLLVNYTVDRDPSSEEEDGSLPSRRPSSKGIQLFTNSDYMAEVPKSSRKVP